MKTFLYFGGKRFEIGWVASRKSYNEEDMIAGDDDGRCRSKGDVA